MNKRWINTIANWIVAALIAGAAMLFDAPTWAAFSVFAVVFYVHGVGDRIVYALSRATGEGEGHD